METARRLFHEQGYHATGVATILREAGVNSGSMYHYFASKDDLLLGVLDQYTRLLRPIIIEPAESATDDPLERIFVLLANYRRGLEAADFRMGCPIGNLALEVGDDNAQARHLISLNFGNWSDAVQAWLQSAGGRLPAQTDRRQLAVFILTVMEGAMMQARAARSLEPFDSSVAQLRAYLDALETAAQVHASAPTRARPGEPHAQA